MKSTISAVLCIADVFGTGMVFSGIYKEPRPILVEDLAVQLQWSYDDCVIARRTNCRVSYIVNCQRLQRRVRTVCRHIPRRLLKYANVVMRIVPL